MFSNVTKWLGVIDNRKDEETLTVDGQGQEKEVEKEVSEQTETETTSKDQEENDDLISPETKKTLEEVSAKAINTAKDWGNYLYAFGKQATERVKETTKELTKTVEEKTFIGEFTKEQEKFVIEQKEKGKRSEAAVPPWTFIGEFTKEQEKFVTEQKEKEKRSEAAVPPWVGYNEEEEMKSQILALSQDKRNFLRNPPTGIQFQFEFDTVFPVAMATLQEDPNLQKMRFELVPKQINEVNFWRNYFYRVSLIKQSTQLTSLAQQTGSSDGKSSDRSRDSSASSSNRERSSPSIQRKQTEEEDIEPGSPPADNEFVSDAFQQEHISDEDFKKEMQLLGVEDDAVKVDGSSDEIPEWEQELQKELQDYEVVNEGGDIDDLEIENEILKQIEQDADQS